jgi:YVTN family beta-propeller protein
MKTRSLFLYLFLFAVVVFTATCRHDDPVVETSAYPNEIGKIMLTRCAITGCHNTASAPGAAGIDLTTWSSMFKGDRVGNSITIPYAHRFSTTFLFTNTYADLGVNTPPTLMPYTGAKLTHDEEVTLRNWIDEGAPDRNGTIMFASNPKRSKVYVVNSGCDVVTVFDEATGLPMRFIPIGQGNSEDAPHQIKVTPDGNYWCVVFYNSSYFQCYRTSDDSYVGQVQLPNFCTGIAFTNDSKYAFVVGIDNNIITEIDMSTLTTVFSINWTNGASMHGIALNPANTAMYVTNQLSNNLVKVYPSKDSLNNSTSISMNTGSGPHEILFSGNHYYVTLQNSSQVAVMDASSDQLITLVDVGGFPQQMAISTSRNLLFVTCINDSVSFPGKRGSVFAIDMNTNTVKTKIDVGWQPNGIEADEAKGLVYVANENASSNGPAPHHVTDCGRDGFLTFIDMNTLKLVPGIKVELASFPISAAIRH